MKIFYSSLSIGLYFLISCFFCIPLQAQDKMEKQRDYERYYFVLRGGLNYFSIHGDNASGDKGRAFGYVSHLRFSKPLGFEVSGTYADFGSKEKFTENGQELTHIVRVNYFSTSLGLSLFLSKYFILQAGVYGAVSDREFSPKYLQVKTSQDEEKYELVDYSDLDWGLYYGFQFYANHWLGLSARYVYGKYNIYEGPDKNLSYKNRGLAVFLNLRI